MINKKGYFFNKQYHKPFLHPKPKNPSNCFENIVLGKQIESAHRTNYHHRYLINQENRRMKPFTQQLTFDKLKMLLSNTESQNKQTRKNSTYKKKKEEFTTSQIQPDTYQSRSFMGGSRFYIPKKSSKNGKLKQMLFSEHKRARTSFSFSQAMKKQQSGITNMEDEMKSGIKKAFIPIQKGKTKLYENSRYKTSYHL